ncbi:MAG TPA: GGDEF domain-containing protein [Acidiferrobacterales bacterium]|nr:GGDEF domain-containing protein [Acidiferrobacterales bacterium]
MSRNMHTSTTERPKAIRSTKLNGKQREGLDATKESTSGRTIARLQQAPSVQELTRALIKSRRQSKSAQVQIKILAERNARLQQELVDLEQKEARARQLAYHDGLTGLPNRSLLQDRFNQAMSQAKRHSKPLALLLLDLDEFKCVNDNLGHAIGDKLLLAVVERLTASIRGADTACRYGGDEFVIMLPEIDSPVMAAAVAAKVRVRLRKPYIIDGYEIRITASVGAAVYPADGQTYDELIKRADMAMYRAKTRGCKALITTPPGDTGAKIQNPGASNGADQSHDHGFFIQDESAEKSG